MQAETRITRPNPLKCFNVRYLGKVFAAALVVVLLSVLTRWAGYERGTPVRLAIGFAQALLIAYTIVLTVHSIRKLDEMQYRMHLEAIAISFATSAAVITGWAFMSMAGLPPMTWGAEAWLMMVLFWALGLTIVRRRYR